MADDYLQNMFFKDILFGDIEGVRRCIEHGADVHKKNDQNQSSLIVACTASYHAKHVEVAKILIDRKVNLDETDSYGFTALHWAIHRQHEDMVAILASNGAALDMKNKYGETALEMARSTGNAKIIKTLQDEQARREEKLQAKIREEESFKKAAAAKFDNVRQKSGRTIKIVKNPGI